MPKASNPLASVRQLLGAGRRAGSGAVQGTGGPKINPGRALLTLTLLAATTCAALAGGLLFAGGASAAVTHKYEEAESLKLSEGVPKGCAPATAPCIAGALTGASGIAPDGAGNIWVADFTPEGARVDRFNDTSGAFVGPQLIEEGGVTGLGSEGGTAVGVGHAFVAGSEQVYVQSEQGVAVYDGGTGKLAGTWTGAHTLGGPFVSATSRPAGVAVDEATLSPAKRDVYVARRKFGSKTEPASGAVDVFAPEEAAKAGEEPAAPVAEINGTCGSPGPCAGEKPFEYPLGVAVSPVNGRVFVENCSEAENRCEVDVFEPTTTPSVYSFVFAITLADKTALGLLQGVAVDGNGDIYVAQGFGFNAGGNQTPNVVDQFSEAGTYLGRLRGTPAAPFPVVRSVGVDPGTHHVFIAGGETVPLSAYGPEVTIPAVEVSAASEIAATQVTLNGVVSLDKAGSAECKFDYGTTEAYGQEAVCEPATVTETEGAAHNGEEVPVKATLTGLQPHTRYFFRVQATNSTGFPNTGEGAEDQGEVTTPGPGLEGEGSAEVASDAATLLATIDPNGLPASYYFQYSATGTGACAPEPGAAGCTTLPVSPEPIGSESREPGIKVSQPIQGLEANQTYHYRVIVISEPTPGHTEVFAEPDQTFTTQPPGAQFALPDNRQWEQVSPPDKHGAVLQPISSPQAGGITQASLSGGAITYLGIAPTEESPPGFFQEEQILSTRGPGGWSTLDISPPHHTPPEASAGNGAEYRFFSEDLSQGVVEPFGEFTSLKPDVFPLDSERTPYLRHDLTCQATPATCYEPVVTGAAGYADVPPGTTFAQNGSPDPEDLGPSFVGASPDLAHVVINSPATLKSGAGGGLYEFSAEKPATERLQYIGGGGLGGETGVGFGQEGSGTRRAVSADGSRVVWTPSNGGALYMRINAGEPQSALGAKGECIEPAMGCTISVAVPQCSPQEGCTGEHSPAFQIASSDGSRVLFTDPQRLVKGASANGLYECEVLVEAAGPRCEVRDVAQGASIVASGGTSSAVLGAGENGSYVYFVSNSVVGDGAVHGASAGDCSTVGEPTLETAASCGLYMAHFDAALKVWEAPVFIATLSGNDEPDWVSRVAKQTARVSPNGAWLAFMSDRSLTGYDNRDAHSGKPDEEVYLYNGETHQLVCASCDPTGARPDGIEAGSNVRLTTSGGVWEPAAWLAANIPAPTPYELGSSRYQSRFLSNGGRLFFNSSDALVPQDINKQEDVYEWEPVDTVANPPSNDSCTEGAVGFVLSEHGCVGLISSGTSAEESAFLDASENGDDVFFLTAEKLVLQDIDTSFDVYDAHVCGAEGVPCAPAGVSPPECTTADACRAAPSPQPGVFGAPASATFSGPGNLAPPPLAAVKPKTAMQIRAEKLARALESCRKDKNKGERQKCEKQARRSYGPVKKSRTSKKKGRKR